MTQVDRLRVATVLAADTGLDVGSADPGAFEGEVHQAADAELVDRGEGVVVEQALGRTQTDAVVGGHEIEGCPPGFGRPERVEPRRQASGLPGGQRVESGQRGRGDRLDIKASGQAAGGDGAGVVGAGGVARGDHGVDEPPADRR